MEGKIDANESKPVLGNPKYELYQPVKFTFQKKDEDMEEKIGIVAIRDPYGTFFYPDEPSYDIFAMDKEDGCLFKHCSESTVKALSQEEMQEYAQLLTYLTNRWIRR